MTQFRAGDRVKLVKHNDVDSREQLELGYTGTFVSYSGKAPADKHWYGTEDVLVKWDKKKQEDWDLYWWVGLEDISHINLVLENV